jgi:small subunit ribosomal protein S14
MARKALIEKEKKRKHLTSLTYDKRQALKLIVRSFTATEEDKIDAMKKLDKLPKNSSPIRIRNRCMLTGRPRGYYRKFKVSRLCFRELALEGLVPGIVKASW